MNQCIQLSSWQIIINGGVATGACCSNCLDVSFTHDICSCPFSWSLQITALVTNFLNFVPSPSHASQSWTTVVNSLGKYLQFSVTEQVGGGLQGWSLITGLPWNLSVALCFFPRALVNLRWHQFWSSSIHNKFYYKMRFTITFFNHSPKRV